MSKTSPLTTVVIPLWSLAFKDHTDLPRRIVQPKIAIQHAGISAQRDQVPLTRTQAHLEDLRAGYSIAEVLALEFALFCTVSGQDYW